LSGPNYFPKPLVMDDNNNLYVAGWFRDSLTISVAGIDTRIYSTGIQNESWIAKFSEFGTLVWLKSFNGSNKVELGGFDYFDGNLYLTINLNDSMDADPDTGTFLIATPTHFGTTMLVCIDTSGSFNRATRLVYSYHFNSGMDDLGNIYLIGNIRTLTFFNFPDTNSIRQPSNADRIFLAKYDSLGSFNRVNTQRGQGIGSTKFTLDDDGNSYLFGYLNDSTYLDGNRMSHLLVQVGASPNTGYFASYDSSLNCVEAYSTNIFFTAPKVISNDLGVQYFGSYNQTPDTFDLDLDPFSFRWEGHKFLVNYLNICRPQHNFETSKFCQNDSLFRKGQWFKSDTILFDTVSFSSQCDSIYVEYLVSDFGSIDTIRLNACDSLISPSGNHVWFIDSLYLDTLSNVAGCDSILVIDLSILSSSFTNITDTGCNQYTSPSGLHTWTQSGVFLDTLTNQFGCDSVLSISLTIGLSKLTSTSLRSCNSFTSPSGMIYNQSTVFTDTLSTAYSCDSLVTFNLSIDTNTTAQLSMAACDTLFSPSGKFKWTSSGPHLDTIQNSVGCDSIMTINIAISSSSSSVSYDTSCAPYSSPSGRFSWDSTAVYTDTLMNSQSCDSVLNIHLEIKKVDVRVSDTLSLTALWANALNATFQWFKCDSTYVVLADETNSLFTPAQGGMYSVEVNQNGCVDTSDCAVYNRVGVAGEIGQASRYALIPNPNRGHFEIHQESPLAYQFEIYSFIGQLINSGTSSTKTQKFELEIASGTYILKIIDKNRTSFLKAIID